MYRYLIGAVFIAALIGGAVYAVMDAYNKGVKSGDGLCRLSVAEHQLQEKRRYDAIIQEQQNAIDALRAALPPSSEGTGLSPVVRLNLERMCDRAAARGESTTSCRAESKNGN